MLKLTSCVTRLPHLTREEFDAYWLQHHAELVRSLQQALRIRRYVQTVPLANPAAQEAIRQSRGTLESNFDGCAELWWESLEDLQISRNTREGQDALALILADERKFVDFTRSQLWYGEEREIIPLQG